MIHEHTFKKDILEVLGTFRPFLANALFLCARKTVLHLADWLVVNDDLESVHER